MLPGRTLQIVCCSVLVAQAVWTTDESCSSVFVTSYDIVEGSAVTMLVIVDVEALRVVVIVWISV